MTMEYTSLGQVEVTGEVVTTVIKSIQAEELCRILLAKYGLENVLIKNYYPLNKFLSLLSDIENRMPTVCTKAGEHIATTALWPPVIKELQDIFMLMDQAYYMNHRGCKAGEIGHYQWEKKAENEFCCISSDVYPCLYNQGIIQGCAKRFAFTANIEHVNAACKRKGDSQCIYRVIIQ